MQAGRQAGRQVGRQVGRQAGPNLLDPVGCIYEKHKESIFDKKAFDSILGGNIRAAKQILHPITLEELIDEAISAKPSAAGLDQWRPETLKMLAKHCPALFEPLARLLNLIEETGEWPRDMYKAYVALIPKDGVEADAGPTDFRPITVLSAIYRLWSRLRMRQSMGWQEEWAPPKLYGCRKGRSAEELAFEVAFNLDPYMEKQGMREGAPTISRRHLT